MMPRTSAAHMKRYKRLRVGVDVTPFVTNAHSLVEAHCVDISNTEGNLLEVETLLALHFYNLQYPDLSSVGAGPVSEQKEPIRVGLGLALTKWGQQAMALDNSGGLAEWNNAVMGDAKGGGKAEGPARTRWLGRPRPNGNVFRGY